MPSLVAEAKQYIGYKSVGINYFNEWYGWDSYQPWCAAFVSFCAEKSRAIFPRSAYVPSILAWAKDRGLVYYASPQIGDIVIFDYELDGVSDHIGIIYDVYKDNFKTIEGNSGDYPGCVETNSYTVSSKHCFVKINYNSNIPNTYKEFVTIQSKCDAHWRIEPTTKSSIGIDGNGELATYPIGTFVDCVGYVYGEIPYTWVKENRWIKSKNSGLYSWAGNHIWDDNLRLLDK